jgi:hypothetical protein
VAAFGQPVIAFMNGNENKSPTVFFFFFFFCLSCTSRVLALERRLLRFLQGGALLIANPLAPWRCESLPKQDGSHGGFCLPVIGELGLLWVSGNEGKVSSMWPDASSVPVLVVVFQSVNSGRFSASAVCYFPSRG